MENQRIRISKAMLKSGMIKLLKEKPLSQITIYELCQVSQINRTTFYKYYGSQEELLNEIETDFLRQLEDKVNHAIAEGTNALLSILQQLYEQRELFCLLVRSLPAQEFASHLFSIPGIRANFQSIAADGECSETEENYILQFLFQGTFSILYSWLSSDEPESVAEIAKILELLKRKLQ